MARHVRQTDARARTGRHDMIRPPAAAPAAEQMTDLRVSNLIDANVKNAANETVGVIADALLEPDYRVKAFIASVGGFRRVGERHVSVAPADVTMARPEFKFASFRRTSLWRTGEVKTTGSITEAAADDATARARAEGMGCTGVGTLSKDRFGVWTGHARKDGREVVVSIDASGRVSTR
ncbi:MAG: PRC-barrel domain-containing protein [Rhizobiales bacterium]|nr:PRC-barrel domain-containing protein [Hyphomicrobiales bacterium]